MDPVKFAVVGLGMGRVRSKNILATEGAELALVVDINEERARTVGEELGVPWTPKLSDALRRKDIECIFVLTETGNHAKVGIKAARAGKHVITTKPMDVSTKACTRLIQECEKAGVHLMVDFQSRYVNGNYALQKAVQDGWLGRPLVGEFRFKWWRDQHYYDAQGGWRGTWKMDGGGSLANQGVHGLDMLMWTMGDVESVFAHTFVMNHQNVETEDTGFVMLDFANGAKGAITSTTTWPERDNYYSLEVHGDKGGVLLDNLLGGTGRYFVPDDVKAKMDAIKSPAQSIVEDAIRVIRHGEKPAIDGREGRRTVALLEAIYKSARLERRVKVQHFDD